MTKFGTNFLQECKLEMDLTNSLEKYFIIFRCKFFNNFIYFLEYFLKTFHGRLITPVLLIVVNLDVDIEYDNVHDIHLSI